MAKNVSKNDKHRVNEIIQNIIDKEVEYDTNDEFYISKRKRINEIFKKDFLSEPDFSELQSLAASKNGFLTNSLRRDLYKKILNVKGKNNQFEFVIVTEQDPKTKLLKFDHCLENDNGVCKSSKENEYDRIIDLDINRSIINTILNPKKQSEEM